MKKILILPLICTFYSSISHAASVLIEPLYGFEKYYRLTPSPKFRTRTMLGARATYGVPHLSAELEVTSGEDTETLVGDPREVKVKREQARLGIRSYFVQSSMIMAFLRLGARGAKDTTTQTAVSGAVTTTEGDVEIDPYLGGGLRINLGTNFALVAGATLTEIKNELEEKDYEVQTSLSASIGVGKF